MKVGRRLAIKVLNAAKFALSFDVPNGHTQVSEAIDQAMLLKLARVVSDATDAFEAYDHTKSLELSEQFFWGFTDDYLELVKERAYNANGTYSLQQQASAAIALRTALSALLRLFAPFLPFATDEVWSWWQKDAGSIHRASWPTANELLVDLDGSNGGLLDIASSALFGIRKAKSDAKVSMKAEIESLTIAAPAADLTSIRAIENDLKSVGRIGVINFAEAEELAVLDVVLKEAEDN